MVNSRRVSFKMVQSFNSSGTLLALKCVWRSLRQRSHAPLSIYRPQLTVDNISQIDWKALRNNDGVCQLIFDKDNCLTLPYSPQIYPPFMEAWQECKRQFNGNIFILSNSAGSTDDRGNEEARRIELDLGVPVLRHRSKKPAGGIEVLEAINATHRPHTVCMIGDRLMTDIAFGNLNGMQTIWTRQPIDETRDNRVAARPLLFIETGEMSGPLTTLNAATSLTNKLVTKAAGTGGRSSVKGITATVFGCTGFLGRYLVNQLGKHGVTVVTPYRGTQEDPRHLKIMGDLGQIVPLRFDTRDRQSLADCVKHSDVVYNLIGRDYETRNFSFRDTHIEAARSIAEVCRENSVDRLIHVSSINANPKSQSQFFQTKGEGETAVRLAFPEAVIVRPGSMFGWEDRLLQYLGHTVTHPVKRWMTFGMIPMMDGGKRTFYPVYVNDVARGLYNLIDTEQPQKLYEFIGPESITYRQLVDLFCEYARRPFSPVSIPYSTFRSIVSITQKNPLSRISVHDIDRWAIDDVKTPNVGSLASVGVDAQSLESLAIRFVRHYRSERWVDQPASMAELSLWEKAKEKSTN